MKKSFLILLSLVVLLSSVLTVVVSAETDAFTEELFDTVMASVEVDNLPDDMYDDDANVTYDNGTTATTKGGILNNVTGDGIGDFVGGVVESVFQDEDVSEQVNDKVEGIGGIFSGIFNGIKDIIPSTNKQTTGSNFFDPITPAITGGFNSNFGSSGNVQQNNSALSSTNAAINGEYVDYNTTVIPYAKPTGALNPGDKGDGVKWLQWILIYTECGLQNPITGEYDDATAAAVKTMQLKFGITLDGIASEEVIEKAEQMYNDYINGISSQGTSSPAVFNTVGATTPQTDKKQAPDITVTIIIVILIIVWIFAIAAVFIIVHIKRKKITLSEDGEIVKPPKEKKKGSRRTRELSAASDLKPSSTLQSLSDDSDDSQEPEEKREVKSLYDRRTDDLSSREKAETSEIEQVVEIQKETETFDEIKPDEVTETEVVENIIAEETKEDEVTTEDVQDEKVEEVQTEIVETTEVEPEQEEKTETEVDTEEVTFEVMDTPINFNSFNDFDYSDDAEIKASMSLREMKERKNKLEEQAKKGIVNSSNNK